MTGQAPELTVLQAEQDVCDLYRRLMIPLRAPINIEAVISKLDASIIAIPSLKSQYQTEALVARQSGVVGKRFIVVVDASLADHPSMEEYQLALGEEAAHLFVDIPTIMDVPTFEDVLEIHRKPNWKQFERNREMVGLVMLSPRSLLIDETKKIYKEVVEDRGFDRTSIEIALSKKFLIPLRQMQQRIRSCMDLDDLLNYSILKRSLTLKTSTYDNERREPKRKKPAEKPFTLFE